MKIDPEKVYKGLIWALPAFLTASGAVQISGGEFYGRSIFRSFQRALGLTLPNRDAINATTYKQWSGEILEETAAASPGPEAILLLIVLLLLVGHVVFRDSVRAITPAKQRLTRLVGDGYRRLYFPITVVLITGGLSAIFFIQSAFWLVAAAILLIVPSIVYLFFYSSDVRMSQFWVRYSYVSVAIFCTAMLIVLPNLYGRRAFDLRLLPVKSVPGRANISGLFVFNEKDNLLAQITQNAGAFTVRLFKAEGADPDDRDVSLRTWLRNYTPPPPALARTEFTRQLGVILDTLKVEAIVP